jgi:hypothetical protein
MSKEAKVSKVPIQMTVLVETKNLFDKFVKETPGNHDTRLAYLLELYARQRSK